MVFFLFFTLQHPLLAFFIIMIIWASTAAMIATSSPVSEKNSSAPASLPPMDYLCRSAQPLHYHAEFLMVTDIRPGAAVQPEFNHIYI